MDITNFVDLSTITAGQIARLVLCITALYCAAEFIYNNRKRLK